ncbi:hypothetical protein [Specibacter sp. RAF43]|uniref:hypothetical protein n=1 Tax=Specibacter sp. RAF43 TaxID=3233057 RepID=UPI003F994862
MGIKYVALAVPSNLVNHARLNPRAFISDRHAWESRSDPPAMLQLDQAWQDFQALFGGTPDGAARAAFELVRGGVTEYGYGWIPFLRVLDARQVGLVAEDLALVRLSGLCPLARLSPQYAPASAGRLGSVARHLHAAQAFTAALARDGLGLIYQIG